MSASFEGLSPEEAKRFAERWLPAWSGNDPERLASFYDDDCFYSDPVVPDGIEGKEALLDYFRTLLARFPDWEWSQLDAIPLEGGFLNLWRAKIPIAGRTVVECEGVCTVQLRGELIARNSVYFDRSELLMAIAEVEVGAE
ncbi:MAG: nuclear transport factor 2 family protein [Actinomycetota bacterium]|nr:nuclear transport factor 2 family protein [Actinomycetota bacterium]